MINWKGGKYGAIEGFCGEISLFTITTGVTSRSRDEGEKYELRCRLPQMKSTLGYFPTQDAAKVKAGKSLNFWLMKAGISNE